jgi:hypothetical protein
VLNSNISFCACFFLEITPSTWRQELKSLRKNTEVKEKKDGDDYSDDFESENEEENNKENDVKADKKAVKRRSPIKYTYKPKPPPGKIIKILIQTHRISVIN